LLRICYQLLSIRETLMLLMNNFYNLVSFVTRGKIRRKVLEDLLTPKTPTILAKDISTHRSTVSRTILALEKKRLVKCLTPEEKMGRYYELSEVGKKVLNELNKNFGNIK